MTQSIPALDQLLAFIRSGGTTTTAGGTTTTAGGTTTTAGGTTTTAGGTTTTAAPDWQQMGADIDSEAAGDYSGYSVSLSSDGSIVAIGAPGNDGTGSVAGHVRVYEYSGSAWVQKGGDIDGEAANDYSGWSVSLSSDGSIVAIGAIYNDGTGSDAGHVRVYEYSGSAWVQKGGDIDGEAAGDDSGSSVSLSSDGSIVAIGAPNNDGTGSQAGHVRVYEYSGSAWVQKGGDIDGEAAGDLSGYSVSLSSSGNIVAIGAYGNDGTGTNAGHVRVYEYSGSAWVQKGGDIDGEAASDQSGYSVSLSSSGNIVAIGAVYNNGTGASAGHVRVYQIAGGTTTTAGGTTTTAAPDWQQMGADIDGEAAGDLSGFSVSLSSDGSIVAIGAIGNDGTSSQAGHVRVYEYDSAKTTTVTDQTSSDYGPSGWRRLGADIDGEAAYDYSGYSVSLSDDGSIVAIGAYLNNGTGTDVGHVRVYEYDSAKTTTVTDQTSSDYGPSGWRRLGADIDGEAIYDESGRSVSLSSDGSIVAIGARYNDGTSSNAGHVRVYQYDSAKTTTVTDQTSSDYGPSGWRRLGADIDGEAVNDYSGWSVSLSSDGSIVAIGAYANDGAGSAAGHVRVYEYDSAKTTTVTDQTSSDYGPSGWRRLGADIDGEAIYDESGRSVSLSSDGSIVAIGAIGNDGTGTDVGHVRVYEYDSAKTTTVTDQTSSDYGPSGWRRLGADIDGEAAGDQSGYSVSLSSDGSIVAIGAYANDGTSSQAGHVRVYEYDSAKTTTVTDQTSSDYGPSGWRRLGADIDGEAANDYSGHSVSLSSSGNIVAIGAYLNDGTGIDAGHVRVYQI